MKKDIARKWVRALRSKKYRQAKGVLKIQKPNGPPSHCCLGVLCELYQAERLKAKRPLIPVEEVKAKTVDPTISGKNTVFVFKDSYTCLPLSVRRWAGLQDEVGQFRDDTEIPAGWEKVRCTSLADLNDHGCSFARIADIIEKNVANL